MTSIVSSTPTFSDLPIDMITYILSLCECNLKEECCEKFVLIGLRY